MIHEYTVRIDDKVLQHLEDEVFAQMTERPYTVWSFFLYKLCKHIRNGRSSYYFDFNSGVEEIFGQPRGNNNRCF